MYADTQERTPSLFQIPLTPAVPHPEGIKCFSAFAGYFEADEYTGWIDESESWKKNCYLGDWSPLGKLLVTGPEAIEFFSRISVNGFKKFAVGQAKHVVFCNEDGKVTGEGILMRLWDDSLLFTSGPGIMWASYMFEKLKPNAKLESLGMERFILQLQGPDSLDVLNSASGENFSDLGFMRFRSGNIEGKSVLVLRQGMSGEIGFEIHGMIEDATDVYTALMRTGQKFGIRRLGALTKCVNHVEACFPSPGIDYIPAYFGEGEAEFLNEFLLKRVPGFLNNINWSGSYPTTGPKDLYRSPLELGWGKSIRFDHEFVGAKALEKEFANPRRTIRTLEWNNDDVVDVYKSLFDRDAVYKFMNMPRGRLGSMETDSVRYRDRLVGATSSRCYSYSFKRMLSLSVMNIEMADIGTEVSVEWGDTFDAKKSILALVCNAPYKQDRRRETLTMVK